ncbi:CpsB/CapC family capsule biosynthesis tyrosine phosphatase [Xanthovirga aplysinae]|uniref:CpsB/CapC family capsule biosynthesis tyrosine phosphatase n=1 Tax=Xanthovirga aplysinae TaxID=2529853 RepID=UPI001656B1A5|nr:capsular biosynthesis protein [Xanthovirga aplysinae]
MLAKLFRRRNSTGLVSPLKVDIHSHLLPGIDDGVATLEDSLQLLEKLQEIGFHKVITTPHIMKDYYPNTPEVIQEILKKTQDEMRRNGLTIQLEAAAEYYLDESFMQLLEKGRELLTFHDRYLLFETPVMNKPVFLKNVIFQLRAMGIKPVMAHPERYFYLYDSLELINELEEMGTLFQINLGSLSGFYSRQTKNMAEFLIDQKKVNFLGSDCHHTNHIKAVEKALKTPYFKKAMELNLLNNSLL